jgi:hypothetical protein
MPGAALEGCPRCGDRSVHVGIIAFGYLSEDVAGGGAVGEKHFARRGVEPSTTDQHLARCADKRSDLFVSRDLFSDGCHDHPPLRGLIECEVCGIWAAHTY